MLVAGDEATRFHGKVAKMYGLRIFPTGKSVFCAIAALVISIRPANQNFHVRCVQSPADTILFIGAVGGKYFAHAEKFRCRAADEAGDVALIHSEFAWFLGGKAIVDHIVIA